VSTGEQIISAFVSSFFEVFVAVFLGAFNAVLLPILQGIPALFGLGA